jgi:hypothetical protein
LKAPGAKHVYPLIRTPRGELWSLVYIPDLGQESSADDGRWHLLFSEVDAEVQQQPSDSTPEPVQELGHVVERVRVGGGASSREQSGK